MSKPQNTKFITWIERTNKSYAEIGKLLECSRQSVSNIANGHRPPGLALANRIAKVSGGKVPASSWGAK
jgi:transcriptional regulator with XRE-family HTH domain